MAKLTDKQRAFVAAKVAGIGNRDAAIDAGYSPACAKVMASKLMNHAGVKAAIKDARVTMPPATDSMQRKFHSSLELMQAAYNDTGLSFAVRFEAAKQALPYEHARMGEKGKKEQRQDAAHSVAKRGRFTPKQAPVLRLVTE